VQQISESYNGDMFTEYNCLKSPFVTDNRRPSIAGQWSKWAGMQYWHWFIMVGVRPPKFLYYQWIILYSRH
jgi:hypothetical protein